ncbi:MAG: hypothetical protein JWM12_1475, partial [Ilumatobacteraceae bacterium]|nr:hypothetical protein [Ilumatobacteraceae bacterium]
LARRLDRLRHELRDEGVPLPDDDELAELLLAEIDYARHPRFHEGVAPRYGALLARSAPVPTDGFSATSLVPCDELDLDVVRRLADGRCSFVSRSVDDSVVLACLDRSVDDEAAAVQLAGELDVTTLQRLTNGWVRVCSSQGVATWDGVQWWHTPHSSQLAVAIHRLIPHADLRITEQLVEFCIHWLGAGRVGAVLTWCLAGDPRDLAHAGVAAAVEIPALDVCQREHFAALRSALSQYDRAALVDPAGTIRTIGVTLRPSPGAIRSVPPYGGTRHTSALRFSHAEPDTVSMVVSSGGPLSVFFRGRRLDLGAAHTADPSHAT